ncbi:MAG: signal peptidase II [Armatimonadota bacterium]
MAGASTKGGRPLAPFSVTAVLTVALDQATKAAALAYLAGGGVSLLGGPVQLAVSRNRGSAFGLPTPPWAAIAIGVVVCVIVLGYAIGSASALPRARLAALGLIVGGALGNLADRLCHGAVIDFIDLKVWPVFNVADIAITVGVAGLAIGAVRRK